jgi:hypothetical protein
MVQRVVLYRYYLEVFVRRCLSVFLLMGGLFMGSGANAAFLGSFQADCGQSNTSNSVSGNVGDTFTVTTTGGFCNFLSTPTGVVTGPPNFVFSPSGTTYTIASAGPVTATYEQDNLGLTLTVNSAPAITSVTPTSGSTAGGTSITITGTNFANSATVNVGASACTSVVVVSSTSLTCTTPPGNAGTASVEVTVGGQTNAANTLFTYVTPAPTVSSVTPTSGSTAGGTSITIAGANFTGATAVSVGGNACTSVSVVSATSITCSTPAGTAGTASVLVTTPGGTNAANTLFTYTAPPTPPQPIPTLSEWAQIMMMLAMIATAGFYGWRMKQR